MEVEVRRLFEAEMVRAEKEGRPVDLKAVFAAVKSVKEAADAKMAELKKMKDGEELSQHFLPGMLTVYGNAKPEHLTRLAEGLKDKELEGISLLC